MDLTKLKSVVLALFGLTEFSQKDGKIVLTEEQKKELDGFKGEGFSVKFLEAVNKELENSKAAEEAAQLQKDLDAKEAENQRLKAENAKHKKDIAALIELPELENPIKQADVQGDNNKGGKTIAMITPNDKFLFGHAQPFMAIDEKHPYNMRAQAALLARQGIVMAVPASSSFDYTSLKQDLGDYYRVRMQDRLQSFLIELPGVENIFEKLSGYQDQAVLVNLFMGEFSQADNSSSDFDDVVKGSYLFEQEKLQMFDVMFAHKFKDLKELEKSWIGYLNKEGSSTMKWSFIQFILAETGKALKNEQNLRTVKGVRKDPTKGKPGLAMEASDGFREFIRKQIALFKIKAFELGEWTEQNAANYAFEFGKLLPAWFRDSGRGVVYCSSTFITAYHKNREILYGGNTDYQKGIMYIAEFPSVKLIPVPGLDESKRLVATLEGNFKTFEDKPNEMFDFNIEQQDWSLKVWSNWKESFWALMVGKKFASAAEQDYDHQMIWCNDVDLGSDYFIAMTADDTTPSVLRHTSLISVANTVATAITDIKDCAVGQEVTLKCGKATNAITIAKAGNFSLISAAWTPSVGDTITFKKRSDGKFIELARTNALSIAVQIANDETTPDVSGADTFVTGANTQVTAITALDNAVSGKVYTIHGAGTAPNASTIANAGNFALTAAMTLSAGKWIKLQKSKTDGFFYEIVRSE